MSESRPESGRRLTSRRDAAPEWYADGLRFQCTQCGNCCSGPPGYVWFTADEGTTIARRLGIDDGRFYEQYARRIGSRWSIKDLKVAGHGHDCVFLDRQSSPGRVLCSIYEDRPQQCRTWPFWPENVESPEAWEAVKRRTPCPGMGAGAIVPLTQIRIQRDAPQP